ncbi:MAG: bifunctional precorrin-2 dehydrogenase/sirohydrochlorin ferrochelatase [Dehalococcoidia bacterium]|nr:bifunctional precorrin-2 dehydrogenase/sirohydrochlorin ferrochelatase [Dehalococcoidia bacterium]
MTNPYYPIFLKVKGERCVVVGGGDVAERKVRTLLGCGALPVVVSPSLSSGLRSLADQGMVKVVEREYEAGVLEGSRLVIAATDDTAVNALVVAEAGERGILVNVVDSAELSDFILPSLVQRGDLTVAISTAGRSPALARKLRTVLEQGLGQEYGELALLLSEVRGELKRRGKKVEGDTWQEYLDLEVLLRRLKQGEREMVKKELITSLARTA